MSHKFYVDILLDTLKNKPLIGTDSNGKVIEGVESDPSAWLKASNQTLLTGNKSGSFNIVTTGTFYNQADNSTHYFGAGDDASIKYDGTNWIFNPKVVGSGYLNIKGQTLLDDKIIFTQTDGNEYIDSLADGYLDLGATTGIRLKSDTTLDANMDLVLSGTGYVDSPSYKAGGTSPVADGTYTVGIGGTTNGTITIKGGIITAVQEAVA